ncbi:MAG TPA: N-acyl homoserine lactonase family protein [Steroidobacteraceae bacterium]|nr:N-acyl homoserine lactonase family protein [Steroidobacteraceae bacterium]
MTSVKRLFVLLCGFEVLPKSISTRDRGGRFILSEPVCAYLLDTLEGWLLLDAGMNPDNLDDPLRRDRHFLRHGMTPPIVRKPHRLETQLDAIGIGFADIGHVVLSHLHYDHCGYLDRLVHAKISVQRQEHHVAFGPATGLAYIHEDYGDPRLLWDLHDGDWQAMPGLSLLDTHGHTAGHQSALIDLPSGKRLLLPFDAGDLQENFDDEVLPGECCDDAAALEAIRRLKSIEAQGAQMLLFHDPVAIQKFRLAPDY